MSSNSGSELNVPDLKLNDGTAIPIIGFGTGTAHYGQECTDHVLSALEVGYRYLDGAQMYENSGSIRDALKAWQGKREDVYVLTKWGMDGVEEGENDPRKVLEKLLLALDLPYVDMYLIHNPLFPAPISLPETWKVMEQLQKERLTRSIGVSNFREEDLLAMEPHWVVTPAVNQIEFHPYVFHAPNMIRLVEFQKKHDIKVLGWAPLAPIWRAPGGPVDPVVKKIAKEKGVAESQVLLAWAARYTDGGVVTTSRQTDRQRIQLESVRVMPLLTDREIDEIADAGKGLFKRFGQHEVWDEARP